MNSRLPRPIFIQSAQRSAIAKFGGSLLKLSAAELAASTLKSFIKKHPIQESIDFVFLGHARQAGCGPNTARQTLIFAGLDAKIPALTLNHACASGLSAIIAGAEKITLGHAQNILAGGVESMSNTPYLLPQARWGHKMGHAPLLDGMHKDGFFCPMADMLMGATVENFLVKDFHISRQEQDDFALSSQEKAAAAQSKGLFKQEIAPITHEQLKTVFENDEHMRPDTSLDSLQKLKPVFDAKNGSVTAGNSSGITDGAAFLHLSASANQETLGEILDWEYCALDPRRMGLGPVESTQKLLARNKLDLKDIAVVELNEAFAAQVIACQRTLNISPDKLNPNGGAIALGHPIGATGARIVVTLLHELKRRGPASLGIATLCVSGGQGVAILLKAH
jgi:acetyl-CoA C-acetyltransferase